MNRYSKQISEKYQQAIKARKSKVVKLFLYVTGFFAVLSGVTFIFYNRSNLYMILFYISAGILGTLLIVLLMLLLFFVSEKPLYEILYPKVIDDHNNEGSIFIKYTPYPKDKEFIAFGGLFPSHASKVLRFKLSFENAHGYPVDFYDAYVMTSNGKTANIHLNGYYLHFRDYSDLKFQLRTQGYPNVKPKYKRLPNIVDVRAFIDESEEDLDPIFVNLYNLIKNEYHSPSVTLGCNGNDLHIGINLRPMRRHVKVLTEDIYQELRRSLLQMIDLANIIK